MFKSHIHNGNSIGLSLEREGVFYFFGNRNFRKSDFRNAFPNFEFHLLKQVHGNVVVPSSLELQEADGHFTVQKNVALVIQTADCLPILLADQTKIGAAHAGWRGIANRIAETLSHHVPNATYAAIGPHIQFSSFEVGTDVGAKLSQSIRTPVPSRPHEDPNKEFIDLAFIADHQLKELYPHLAQIDHLTIDTMKDLNFHSFRRDGAKAERQYSFIVKI